LTDIPYFQGKDEYINVVKRMSSLPVLRKDFILDPYQVVESRALGADCILLIMAALSDEQAIMLEEQAVQLGLDVLVEVHNEQELFRALKLKTKLIGINNRDLKTLKIDIATTEILAPLVPSDRIVVCESGIYSPEDIERINDSKVRAFLVGESLMVQQDVKAATMKLLGN
jgi:indole-3-glycerol phosphate synthase